MNVPFQVKVPIKSVATLSERLKILQDAHAKRRDLLEKKIKAGNPKNLDKLQAELLVIEREGRVLTANNLLRVVIEHGVQKLGALDDESILQHLADTGLTRGRVRAA